MHKFAFAAVTHDQIVLTDTSKATLVSQHFRVYKQDQRILTFEEFVRARDFLAYSQYDKPNYGFNKNGIWLYAQLQNQSDARKLFLSIRFSQIQDAQLYVLRNGQVIYQNTDGIQNKTSPYALPLFEVDFAQNENLDVYLYLRSSSMNLVAPIYIQDQASYISLSVIDYSIWGTLYGVVCLLAIFAIAFFVYNRSVAIIVYLTNLLNLLVFQLLWSGHSVHLPEWITHSFIYLRAESVILLTSVTATVFTLIMIPYTLQKKPFRQYLNVNGTLGLLCAFLFLSDLVNVEIKQAVTYFIAFSSIIFNLLIATCAFKQGFFPGRPLVVGWTIGLLGSLSSAFFIFGILPQNEYHQHIFYSALVAQAVAFLLCLLLKKQYDLQLEVQEAQTDAENNFYLIEEQNVHLDLARKNAIKASEVKSQFLANMSHEIRTPLNAIIGFSKELESKQHIMERDEHVRIINSAASDLLSIVNDVLDFSKMEAGKLTLNSKPFSPRDLLEDVAALMSKSAHLKQLEFIFDVNELPTSLVGDAVKIKQLLSNLLSNALKFTNYGHIVLKAMVIEQDDNRCVIEFQVEDSGIGISESDINKLFTAFHQLDDELNRSFQGTGLGLVISQELTSLMNGQISVSSTPSKGSIFAAKIPFVIDHSATLLSAVDKFKGQKAILVDDWALSRDSIAQQLQLTGFEVDKISNIEELAKRNIQTEHVVLAMPYANRDKRAEIIEQLSKLDLINLVLLYSGPEPSTHLFSNFRHMPRMLRLPLSTRKLTNVNQKSLGINNDISERMVHTLPKIRMLAVDDMELNLRLIETWLAPSLVTLDLAYNGKDAIALCEQNDYDIILMDIQMPHMDGLTATSLIRKTELNLGTPIVAVTAHALESEKQHYLDSGMDDFLSKPINIESLTGIIKTWCEEYPEEPTQAADTVDWNLMLARSNNKKADAISFFNDFVASLQQHANEIEIGWQEQRKDLVLASIHKLHGASCYTGVPRLQNLCRDAQEVLKQSSLEQHSKMISTLLLEIEQIIAQWPQLQAGISED